MARLEFDRGPESYGLLGTFLAVGSLTGALLAASRERARMRLVVGAVLAFGVTSSVAALMPTYWTFAASLVLVGLSALTLMTAANATVQLSTPPEMRGRVMALYFAVFIGGTPLGAPVVGWVGETFGARWTIAVGGVTALLAGAAALAFLARRSVRRPALRRRRPPPAAAGDLPAPRRPRARPRGGLMEPLAPALAEVRALLLGDGLLRAVAAGRRRGRPARRAAGRAARGHRLGRAPGRPHRAARARPRDPHPRRRRPRAGRRRAARASRTATGTSSTPAAPSSSG